jgi:hypothetical protein
MVLIFVTPGGGEGLERGRQRFKRNIFSIQKPESLVGEEKPTSGKVVEADSCVDQPVRPIFIELVNEDGDKDVLQQVQINPFLSQKANPKFKFTFREIKSRLRDAKKLRVS